MAIDRRSAMIGVATFAAVGTAVADTPIPSTVTSQLPTERVLGIGGFFFRSHDPKALAQWYQTQLGVDPVPMDKEHHAWQQTAGPTAFSPFPMETKYFARDQGWMLNFRVRDLDAMAAQLRKAGIEVKIDPDKYPNGRFARLHDPEGNPIELWEPAGPS